VIHVLHQNALSVPTGLNHLTQELHAQQSNATMDLTSIVLITDVTSVPTPTIALYVLTRLLAIHARMATICTLRQKHAEHAMLAAERAQEQQLINVLPARMALF
jgi:hypothetical protein